MFSNFSIPAGSDSGLIYVMLVEDDDDIRKGLRLLIDGTDGMKCVGDYRSCEDCMQKIAQHLPDVLLLDIELPGMSGVEGIRQFKALVPELDIMMLTVHEEDNLIFESLCAGASGYMVKTTAPGRLISAIHEIHGGGSPMSTQIARRVIESFRQPNSHALTTREQEILRLLCKGNSYKMIAGELGISRGTVHCHIKNIYKKLQVHSSSQAVAKAMREKLVY